ncbi:choline dehydrogenase-like flavoprotein [Maribacter spongiicola]|uniref:Choline dehydrogenase-like flavoprotein n=1 Tax=Maribacter spongiicola TaxID=1206753 RepID=A0A4R7K580_9FLAO|nr:GMC family oxidoreductase N-terminal domain-containing protein [Maribacter spongiicola]TDT45213.1 choline dehydrogenase-like flavoprotein [Maribacter spongiicola]
MENAYDYIVVGGGTAGPVVATRLTENPENSVVILEAGKENIKEAMNYVNGVGQMWAEDTNWGFMSTPQKGLNGRKLMQPRGKVMGGSAAINIGSWSRGTAINYNSWNIADWDWETILKWYLKIENSDRGANEFRGADGPMKLETTPEGTYMTQIFKQACLELGLGATEDLNAENNEGFDVWQCIYKNGTRHNTIHNYLNGARLRSNLSIETEAFVSKVIIENGKAVGVEYFKDGKYQTIKANKEVILCTGTFATPKILMLSGIGPAAYLESLNIKVHKDLPGVGENLADHLRTDIGVTAPDGVGVSLRANAEDPKQLEEWRKTGYGPLSVLENTSASFFKSSPDVPVADLELMFNINAPVEWGKEPTKNAGYHIDIGLVQPKSKGTLHLASADPKDSLLINPNYLSDKEDIQLYIKGIRKALEFFNSKALKPFTDHSTITLSIDSTDAEIEDYIRNRAESIYHPVGTAKMGNDDDPLAVVNNKLQVRGIEKLRIADASVIPNLISGHTMAPTVLIAERAADFIRKI